MSKGPLKLSILANVVLAALTICLTARVWITSSVLPQHPAVSPLTAEEAGRAQSPPAEAKPFQWSSLESTNYLTYIANLRGIGCPEQTIRDIITADVRSLHATQQRAVDSQRGALGSNRTASGAFDRDGLEAARRQLLLEQDALVSALMEAGSSGPESGGVVISRPTRERAQDRIVVIPLALKDVDPSDLKLDDRQIAVIAELRQKFQEDVGGPGQDPNDPAYLRRWQEAQRENDELFTGMLGGQFYLDYQLQATNAPFTVE
jgi:hypothetical protein